MSDWQTAEDEREVAECFAGLKNVSIGIKRESRERPGIYVDPKWAFVIDSAVEVLRRALAAAPPPPAIRVTPQMVEACAKAIWSLEWPHDPTGWDQVWGPAKERFVETAKAVLAVSFPIQQDADIPMTPDRITALVDRFLAWPLPESACADVVATRHGEKHRTGTNLLSATEARQMIEYLLAAASIQQDADDIGGKQP